MAAILSLTESNILQALGDFIVNVTGMAVVQGQDNRVPEPGVDDYAIMWPTLRERLSTNVALNTDTTFLGNISGATLTVTSIAGGSLLLGSPVYGVGVALGTVVTAFGSGTGGDGTYTVTPSQTVTDQAMAAGLTGERTGMSINVQVDVHGPNSTDNTQRLVTLFRDAYGCDFFTATGFDIQPLYIDDGQQTPFVNGEGQYEDRWVLQVKLQANPVVMTGQQFADTLSVGLKEIDVTFPPGDA